MQNYHEIKKISRIIDELLTYFLPGYQGRAEIVVEETEQEHHVVFTMPEVDIEPEDYVNLVNEVQVSRNPELEHYYWPLAGESDSGSQLTLVAMMSDSIDISYEDNCLVLSLTRKKPTQSGQ